MITLPLLTALVVAPIALPDPPAKAGAMAPHLIEAGGAFLLSWTEPGALKMAWLKGRRWGPARTVAQSDKLFANWADFGGVVMLQGGHLAAHWREKEGDGAYAYGVRLGLSKNAGRKWTILGSPHEDGTPTEHGFVALDPDAAGGAWAYWLDGRNTVAKPPGPMTLRRAYLDRTGRLGPSEEIDNSVCDCCPTSSAAGAVVYRDRTQMDVRDIRVAVGGATHPVAHDSWVVQGCPVNGPALAEAPGGQLVTAWYTQGSPSGGGPGGPGPRVLLARSDDGGRTWSDPAQVAGASALGRVDVVVDKRGDAYVSWLDGGSDQAGHDATLRVRRVSAGGGAGEPVAVAPTSSARTAGIPQVALRKNELVFAWTRATEPTSIQMATLPTAGVPEGEDPYRLPPGAAGRVVVVRLWSLTCRPCMEELPSLADLHRSLMARGGMVLAINVDPPADAKEVRAAVNRMRLPFPVIHDPKGDTGVRANVLPTTVVFDRSGRPVARFERQILGDDTPLVAALARAGLGRPGPPATPLARPPHKTPLKGGSHAHPKLPGRPRTHP